MSESPHRQDADGSCWIASKRGPSEAWRSTRWFARRGVWAEEWKRRYDAAPACRVCGRLWTPRTGDLHDIRTTGGRPVRFEDFTPLCRAHHAALHSLVRASSLDRLGDRAATYESLSLLQRKHRDQATP